VSHDPFLAEPRVYFGATLGFDGPHVLLEAMLPAPAAEWPALRAHSVAVARRLAAAIPARRAILLAAAAGVTRLDEALDPWSAWVKALGEAQGVPDWPIAAEVRDDGGVRLRLTCPYPAGIRWARTALQLLRLTVESRHADVTLAAPAWGRRLGTLGEGLQSRPAMALHRALAELGVPFVLEGRTRTLVGLGSRLTTVTDVSGDPQALARELADRDLSIPVYTVTGSIGKTTTVRLLVQLLEESAARVGFTSSYGSWLAGRQLEEGDKIGARAALRLLYQPDIDAAVLELGRRGLLFVGMPLSRTDVAVLLNVEAVHLGINGVDTLEQMATVKGLTLEPARIAVLNYDDRQCRRLGEARQADGLVWFSRDADAKALRGLSLGSLGALGVERDPEGRPAALAVWIKGKCAERLSLAGVAPYHGMLGEKTVEELLGAVAAARWGPLTVPDIAAALPRLKLDASTHAFRTSVHPRGSALFVLDKAAEEPSMHLVGGVVDELCRRHGIIHRIAIFCRAATLPPDTTRRSVMVLHGFVDEMVYFDRPDAYDPNIAAAGHAPGSLPALMKEVVAGQNEARGTDTPLHLVADWEAATAWLRERFAAIDGPVLVLINQPGTALVELSRAIVNFVEAWQDPRIAAPEIA